MRATLLLTLSFICHSLFGQDNLNMEVLYHWDEGGTIASSAWGNIYNEVWGYASNGREYAIIGTTEGTHFLDVTIPEETVEVDFVAGEQQGPIVVHRDYHNLDNYLYMVCQEGQSSLQIVDLSYLPDSVHLVYDSNELVIGTHNIFIDTTQAVMYTVFSFAEGINNIIRWQRIDISEPTEPVLIDQSTTGPYIHDLYVDDGIAILNRGNTDMAIYDYNQEPPMLLGSIDGYPGQGYNHSGYPTPDWNYYVMADETHGSPLKMLDISDFTDIQVLSTVSSGVNDMSIAHNQIIHNNIIYSAYYYDGVYAWGIEDPENPVLLGYYDTSVLPHQISYEGAWGVYPFLPSGNLLVSDMQTGLWIFSLDTSLRTRDQKNDLGSKVWPNPASESIRIHANSRLDSYSISNLNGQLLQTSQNLRDNKIDVSHLPAGIYVLRLESSDGFAHHKIIVE